MSPSVSADSPTQSPPGAESKPSVHKDFGIGAMVARLDRPHHAAPAGRQVHAAERWIARRILQAIGDPPIALVLWDGQDICTNSAPPVARVLIHDRRTLLRLVLKPELHFGDAYTSGRIKVQGDLLAFLETVYRSMDSRGRLPTALRQAAQRLIGRGSPNSLAGSRRNIHHHYDIGDDFYKLWLDGEMVYTCAYFPAWDVSLEEAQAAKMDLICRKLWLKPGETVIEAGCGWGGLARYMARHCGATVRAFNVSHEQIQYARRRAREEGLDSRIEYIEDDYRTVQGQFDAFVSVGMLEHVGPEHYGDLGGVIARCLSPSGRGLLHSIGRNRPGRINPWIEQRIFPGAYPPSLRELLEVLEPQGFTVLDVENLRLHYAQTVRHWLARFDAAQDRVAEMFDDRFLRAWRLYLTGSIAGFTAGSLQLFQVLFARPGVNDVPWTRQRLWPTASGAISGNGQSASKSDEE